MLAFHVKEMIVAWEWSCQGTISFYVILIYVQTFARTQLHLPLDQAFLAQSMSLACEVVLISAICGVLSAPTASEREPVMIAALVLDLLVTYPLFSWVSADPSFGALLVVQWLALAAFSHFDGPISTALAEQFPTRVRSTALAISCDVAVMLFGGFAQFFRDFG